MKWDDPAGRPLLKMGGRMPGPVKVLELTQLQPASPAILQGRGDFQKITVPAVFKAKVTF